MINCENGSIKMVGKNMHIALDFLHILDTLIEANPEIVISVISHRADLLEKTTETCNMGIVIGLDQFYDLVDKERKS